MNYIRLLGFILLSASALEAGLPKQFTAAADQYKKNKSIDNAKKLYQQYQEVKKRGAGMIRAADKASGTTETALYDAINVKPKAVQLNQATQALSVAKADLAAQEKALDAVTQAFTDYQAKAKSEQDKLQQDLDALNAELKTKEAALATSSAALDAATKSAAAIPSSAAATAARGDTALIAKLQADVANLNAALSSYAGIAQAGDAQLNALNEFIKKCDDEIAQLNVQKTKSSEAAFKQKIEALISNIQSGKEIAQKNRIAATNNRQHIIDVINEKTKAYSEQIDALTKLQNDGKADIQSALDEQEKVLNETLQTISDILAKTNASSGLWSGGKWTANQNKLAALRLKLAQLQPQEGEDTKKNLEARKQVYDAIKKLITEDPTSYTGLSAVAVMGTSRGTVQRAVKEFEKDAGISPADAFKFPNASSSSSAPSSPAASTPIPSAPPAGSSRSSSSSSSMAGASDNSAHEEEQKKRAQEEATAQDTETANRLIKKVSDNNNRTDFTNIKATLSDILDANNVKDESLLKNIKDTIQSLDNLTTASSSSSSTAPLKTTFATAAEAVKYYQDEKTKAGKDDEKLRAWALAVQTCTANHSDFRENPDYAALSGEAELYA